MLMCKSRAFHQFIISLNAIIYFFIIIIYLNIFKTCSILDDITKSNKKRLD